MKAEGLGCVGWEERERLGEEGLEGEGLGGVE